MKVTKARATENRGAIEKAAAALIRERGFDQMSVAKVASAAGLTHGALYSHYGSKEALAEAAARSAFEQTLQGLVGLSSLEFVQRYLSPLHRDHPEVGCPNAALVSEVWRQPTATRDVFRDGVQRYVELIGATPTPSGEKLGRTAAVTILATLVGAMALSRAIGENDPSYSNQILSDVHTQLATLIEEKAFSDLRS